MKKNLKNIAKILIVSVLLTSCASENLDLPNQDPPLVMAKKWFETSKPDLKVLNYTNTIDWNNSIISSGDKGTIIEVPLLLKDNVVAKVGDDKSFKTYNRLMFFPDEKETYKAYQVLITTDDKTFDSKSKECNFYKLNTDFNGYITVLNSKNEITDFDKYLDLKPVSKPILNKTTTDPVVCVYYGYWDENDEFHAYYQVGCYGGGSGSSGGTSYGSGGGKGDAEPNPVAADQWIDNSNNLNKLCGSYNFSTIGNASVANINGLGLSAKNGIIVVFAQFTAPMCITIPNYNTNFTASQIFNLAWNTTMSEVMLELNNYSTLSVSSELIKGLIKTTLLVNLNNIQPGSSLNIIGCAGAPTTQATYCP